MAKEVSAAVFDCKHKESRDDSDFKSFCVAYMVSSRYGVDTKGFSFDKLPKEFEGMETQEFKEEFKVPYKTQKGTKYAVLYNEGFCRVKCALGSYADIIPEYEQMNKPKELFFRYKANVCEMCGAYVPAVKVYQVKSMSDLDVNTEWGAIMNGKKRKTLVVCGDCYDRIHK